MNLFAMGTLTTILWVLVAIASLVVLIVIQSVLSDFNVGRGARKGNIKKALKDWDLAAREVMISLFNGSKKLESGDDRQFDVTLSKLYYLFKENGYTYDDFRSDMKRRRKYCPEEVELEDYFRQIDSFIENMEMMERNS